MGYKLADGSDSDDYEVGDSFIVGKSSNGQTINISSVISLSEDDGTENPRFFLIEGETYHGEDRATVIDWACLTPTEETKRKVEARLLRAAGSTNIEHTDSGSIKCRQGGREYLIPNKPMTIKEDAAEPDVDLRTTDDAKFVLYDDNFADRKNAFNKHYGIFTGVLTGEEIPINQNPKPDLIKHDGASAIEEIFGTGGNDSGYEIYKPEPLARIVDWRGGEEVKPLDFVVSSEFGVDYRAVVLEVISPTQIRTCRGVIGRSHGNMTIIRINTAAIPKQRTMTRAEVEEEFGIRVVD